MTNFFQVANHSASKKKDSECQYISPSQDNPAGKGTQNHTYNCHMVITLLLCYIILLTPRTERKQYLQCNSTGSLEGWFT